MIAEREPLSLNLWRSPELLSSPASAGDSAIRDPLLEMRERQLQWLQLVAHSPTRALQSALKDLGWSIRRNVLCERAPRWPCLDPELNYPGEVLLDPVDSFPQPGAGGRPW